MHCPGNSGGSTPLPRYGARASSARKASIASRVAIHSPHAVSSGNGAFAVYTPDAGQIVRTVQPRTGLMLMFPNTLWHGVLRYDSEKPRIVISFNLA